MNDLADHDTALRLRILKRLHEDTQRLAREYQAARVDWQEVVEAFETLNEAIAAKWTEGQ